MPYEAGRALLFEKMQFELNVEGVRLCCPNEKLVN